MAYHATSAADAPRAPASAARMPEMSGWVGWIAFAATIMILLGIFHAIEGIVALTKDEYFLVGQSGLVVNVDYTAWGWAYLIGGLIVLAAGFGILAGRLWARTVAVAVAGLSAVLNLVFIAAYPVWSVIMIALAVLVIWALTVHGSELKEQ